MAQRWSPQRRALALTMRKEGSTARQVAKELDLPTEMVKDYFSSLGTKSESSEKAPTKTKKAAPTKSSSASTKKTKKGPAKKKVFRKSGSMEGSSREERIEMLLASVNNRLGANVLRRASEASTDYLLRRPTGLMELDIGLGGGWPGGSLCVLAGPDGAGKDYLLNLTLAMQQQIMGDEFSAMIYSTEFKFDKLFARDMCGFQVALTDEELDRMNLAREEEGLPLLTLEERAHYQTQIGEVLLVDGVIADDGLDIVLDAVATNSFQVITINSLGVLQTAAKEDKDNLREHAQQSNEAQLLSRFMPQLFMLLNRDVNGKRNYTTVLATSQVRAKRDMPKPRPGIRIPEKAKYVSGSGSKALAHGKAIELMVHKGSVFRDTETKPPQILGREVEWETLKGKLGTHDGIQGSFDFWFDEGADILGNLINTAARLEVINVAGAWYTYQPPTYEDEDGDLVEPEPVKSQGVKGIRTYLEENPDAVDDLRKACLRAAGIVCLYKIDEDS